VKHWSVVVIALAMIVSLAGCGSGKGNNAAPASPRQTAPAQPATHATAAQGTPAKSKVSTGTGKHGKALRWIRRLQRDLTRLHFYSGPVTGVETPETKNAVIRFQRAAHLKPDSLWGPKSQAALDKMLGRKPSKPPPALGWIRNLQRDLTRLHFYSGPVTGVETPETKIAVIRFQRAAHLKPDGLWGSRSQVALDKMLHRLK
jgi:peptidoglycan hydrolase-like protein with peptidoglycan-binding domain